jgi:hypothetical protein
MKKPAATVQPKLVNEKLLNKVTESLTLDG